MKKTTALTFALSTLLLLTGCSSGEETASGGEPGITLPSGRYAVARCKVLNITPAVTDGLNYTFAWSLGDSLLSTSRTLSFIALEKGEYDVLLTASLAGEPVLTRAIPITVSAEDKSYSPYVTSVYDYLPAPGQFTNVYPEYETGDTQQQMNQKALQALGYNTRGLVSLGGFGGYVVVGFDHTIVHVPGTYDFRVLGNAFEGSSEPGVVQVAYDRNGNGRPDDDEWYELEGSEHGSPATVKNYSITYTRPDEGKMAVPGTLFWQTDTQYLPWSDGMGRSGFLTKNMFHSQSYYPAWVEAGSLTFKGTLLPSNGANTGTDEEPYWVQNSFAWGYADNVPNDGDGSKFKIDWAVDKDGNRMSLPGVDFVKVYTGLRQECGWLGETSTEVCGVTDLHL